MLFLSKSEIIFIIFLYLCVIRLEPCFQINLEYDSVDNWPRLPQHSLQNQINDYNFEDTAPRLETIENDSSEGEDQNILSNTQLCPSKPPEIMAHTSRTCNRFKNFIGSNLFDGDRKSCFSPEDINLLVARREFELMIPTQMPTDLLCDKDVCVILRYFNSGNKLIDCMRNCGAKRLIKKAFIDTFGGFLHFYLLPASRISYYAGRLKLKTMQKVTMHYNKCRHFLNTNGNGWREPIQHKICKFEKVDVQPLIIDDTEAKIDKQSCREQFCSVLDLMDSNKEAEIIDENIIVALPRTDIEDNDGFLGNIWLPFKKRRTYNLRSAKSTNILLQFYKSVNRCYQEKNIPLKVYNKNLEQWIAEFILPHLNDCQFYPGLGNILSIYKYLRTVDQKNCNSEVSSNQESEEMPRESEVVNSRVERHEDGGDMKKNSRTSLKYADLEKKAQEFSSDFCDMDWLKEINDTINDEPFKSRKIAFKKKLAEKKKKDNSKFSFGNLLNWKGFSIGGTGPAWLESLKKILIYLIVIVLFLLLICLLFKLVALCFTVLLGAGGTLGANCCQLIWLNIMAFIKQFINIFLALCSCAFTLCRCCFVGKEAQSPYSRKRDPELEASNCDENDDDSDMEQQSMMIDTPSAINETSTDVCTETARDYRKDNTVAQMEKKPLLVGKRSSRWKSCWLSKKSKDPELIEKQENNKQQTKIDELTTDTTDVMSTTTDAGSGLGRRMSRNKGKVEGNDDDDDEDGDGGGTLKSKRGRRRKDNRRNKSESKRRLRGGQSNLEESIWRTDSSRTNARQAGGSKTSWQTIYDL